MIRRYLQQAATFQLPSLYNGPSTFSAMATPPQSFQLDRQLFNDKVYTHMLDFWFDGFNLQKAAPEYSTLQKWYGLGRSEEQKAAFDQECRDNFGSALESIAPSQIALPPFQSWDEELKQAETLAKPFLDDVKQSQQQDKEKGASTALALILLLDQMPRNIYRDSAGLKLVYEHYDRLAFSFMRSCLNLTPNPLADAFVGKPVYTNWIWLPLVHAEHLPSHGMAEKMIIETRGQCEAVKDEDALKLLEAAEKARKEHLEPMERFGRYPHRNQFVGRDTTAEEAEYLKTANTFGVTNPRKEET